MSFEHHNAADRPNQPQSVATVTAATGINLAEVKQVDLPAEAGPAGRQDGGPATPRQMALNLDSIDDASGGSASSTPAVAKLFGGGLGNTPPTTRQTRILSVFDKPRDVRELLEPVTSEAAELAAEIFGKPLGTTSDNVSYVR